MWRSLGPWTAGAFLAGVLLAVGDPSTAAETDCGKSAADSPADAAPVKADLTPVKADHVITLGRSTEGSRTWEIEFIWTAKCTLKDSDISPTVRNVQGSDLSLDSKVLTPSAVVDGAARSVRVTLDIPRDPKKVPAGKFEGTLGVGSGSVGLGQAALTIRHQEPLTVSKMSGWSQSFWIVIGLAFAVVLFGAQEIFDRKLARKRPRVVGTTRAVGADRNSQDFTTPLAVIVGALALYPLVARVGGTDTVPWPAWPVWLGAAGLIGGVIIGILKHRDSSEAVALVGGQRFATALLLSFGAGITAWRAQYLNSPDWALTLESALGLLGVVGGATATAALLFLSPNPKPLEPPSELKPKALVHSENQAPKLEDSPVVGAKRVND